MFPCAYDDVICVGAVDKDYERWEGPNVGSGFGSKVTIWAPGADVSTYNNNGDVIKLPGTSFAAPLVAGIIATYYGWEGTSMNPAKVLDRLNANAENGLLSGIKSKSPNKLANNGYLKAGGSDDKPYIDAPAKPPSGGEVTQKSPSKTTAQPSTATTSTPKPEESCHTQYDFLFDEFNIWGVDWNIPKLGKDGSGLKSFLGHCSAITDWYV